ncbi:MAG TPA: GHKL domain-containing protein [Candidatus Nitrosocosmicus sp.]|nr:GHKL domain-containing protein [Candidatus Nitrosocosmicus sp.]
MIVLYKIFINTMAIVIFSYMTQTIYNFQRDKMVFLKYVIITAVGGNILFFLDKYLGMGLKALSIMLIMAIMAYFTLKLSVLQCIVSTIIFAIALAVGDISAVFLLVKVYGYTHEMIMTHLSLSITADLVIYGTVIIIIFLIRLIRQTQEMTDKYKRSITIKTSVYMLATFMVIAVNYSVYIKFIGVVDQNTILINVAIMWMYLILSLYINFTNSALVLKEQQYDQQQDYIATIDSLINDFRRLKHSYANTIYSFYGYIQENDLEGLKAYYSDIMDETRRMDSNLLLALQKIKVYAIFGLLWNKINDAESKGIEVGVQVPNEVHNVGIKLTDLGEVLGNYLDNAIDAAAVCDVKKINISIVDADGYLTINIENTFDTEVDIKEVNSKGYSTKGMGRGYGLFITKQILSKYTNVLNNTFAEDNVFKQEIIIKK